MAQVVLTNAQKELVVADAAFRAQVKWAILNKASFWKGVEGIAVPGGQTIANLNRWAKSRSYGALILGSPGIAENSEAPKEFVIFAKNYTCVDDQVPFEVSNVIDYLLNDLTNNFESLADNWFDAQIALTLF